MKTLACVLIFVASILCNPAYAASEIQLPSPLVFKYAPPNPNCPNSTAEAWTSANGFTADGNYLNGISYGWIACGHSGRGSNLIYTRYCFLDVWDLNGNLVSVTVQPYTACYAPMQLQPQFVRWTNPVNPGYSAYTVTDMYYGYIQSRYAVLDTP